MSCISEGNKRCTKCCEAIHVPKKQYINAMNGKITLTGSQSILKLWKPISKRRAKKINPWMFEGACRERKRYHTKAQFFTCKALDKELGCTIREEERHPEVCKVYKGGNDYSPTCEEDINIIARG